jgi:hypothetical protein
VGDDHDSDKSSEDCRNCMILLNGDDFDRLKIKKIIKIKMFLNVLNSLSTEQPLF